MTESNLIESTPTHVLGAAEVRAESMLSQLQRWAHQYPRAKPDEILAVAIEELETLPHLAQTYFYAIPYRQRRGDDSSETQWVTGMGVHGARSLLRIYGNAASGAEILDFGSEEDDRILCMGRAIDLERNVIRQSPVYVSRWARRGGQRVRLGEDQMQQKIQASVSKAERNAILGVLPRWLVESVFQRARTLVAASASQEQGGVAAMLRWFSERGIPRSVLERVLGRRIVPSRLAEDDIALLRGFANAIQNGETTLAEALREWQPAEVEPEPVRRARGRVARAQARPADPEPEPGPEPGPAPEPPPGG